MKKWGGIFLCLLGLVLISDILMAQERFKAIEYVLSAGGFDPINGYTYVPTNQGVTESFDSGPKLTVSIPPAPLSDAIFFEMEGQYWWYWGAGTHRYVQTSLVATVQSPDIPNGISIFTAGAGMEMGDINAANVASGLRNRFTRISKYRMARGTYLTSWTQGFDVVYAANNEKVPQDQAIRIINRLMNRGFDLVFSIRGSVLGVDSIINTMINLEVTRLAK